MCEPQRRCAAMLPLVGPGDASLGAQGRPCHAEGTAGEEGLGWQWEVRDAQGLCERQLWLNFGAKEYGV